MSSESQLTTIHMRVCVCSLDSYDPDDILKVKMPRGSVLLFTGGMIHGSGVNSTDVGRKSLLSSYQLGWLRPEYKFWAHKELHRALSDGLMSEEITELMGHYDNIHSPESEYDRHAHASTLLPARLNLRSFDCLFRFSYTPSSPCALLSRNVRWAGTIQENGYLGRGMEHIESMGMDRLSPVRTKTQSFVPVPFLLLCKRKRSFAKTGSGHA